LKSIPLDRFPCRFRGTYSATATLRRRAELHSRENTMVESNNTLISLAEKAEANALIGCGQSDYLFTSRVQAAYANILSQVPEANRSEAVEILKARGFDPDFEEPELHEDDCSLTGIEAHHCPCGHHE